MTARHMARSRWHLEARREQQECGCIWVITDVKQWRGYRSWSCLGHRWTRGEALERRRGRS